MLPYSHLSTIFRDCMDLNIMMDANPLYSIPYHPVKTDMRRDFKGKAKHSTRTQQPVKYYLTDFGISRHYEPDAIPLEDPIWGGDKTVPEFQKSDEPCNPFPTDVYYLGNLIREDFLKVSLSELLVNHSSSASHRALISLRESTDSNSWRVWLPIWFKTTHQNDLISTKLLNVSR
jgi:hypothetical protein